MEYVLGGIAGITGVASLYLIVSWTYMKTHSMWCLMSIFAHVIGTVGLCYTYQVGYITNIYELALLYMLEVTLFWGSTIDKLYYILPDEGAILICICGFVYQWIGNGDVLMIVVNALCMGGLWCSLRWFSRGGVGLGDIKWLIAISCWLTSVECLALCGLSSVIGILYSCVWRVTSPNHTYIPFGPSFSMATILLFICPVGRWLW